jgi:hypothetical protein
MAIPKRVSVLFFIGFFIAGSTALGYYYYFVYEPPLKAAEQFMKDMETQDAEALRRDIVLSMGIDGAGLREPEEQDVQELISEHFIRGRILDQRTREGRSRDYYYLVYREPDGRVYALVVTLYEGRYLVVIPEPQMRSKRHRYLWDYTWTN